MAGIASVSASTLAAECLNRVRIVISVPPSSRRLDIACPQLGSELMLAQREITINHVCFFPVICMMTKSPA
jgi:hypothetical protein